VNLIVGSVIALIARFVFFQMLPPEPAGLFSMGVLAIATLGSAFISMRQVKGL
jgi:fluoride ion exporter CrcB/FEX